MVLYGIILSILLAFIVLNIDQLTLLKRLYYELWLVVIINAAIIAADALMMMVFRSIVTMANSTTLQRI